MQEKDNQNILLELDRVSHFFDQRLVFKDISLSLGKGQVLLLAGPNGAGKTTLVNIMTGLIRPVRGTVHTGVSSVKAAYLGHHTFIYPGLSALENLRFWAGMYSLVKSEEELLDLLALVGLRSFAYENARIFSRGMSQRLSLARVLMLEPELIFLDEPATGMDAQSRRMLREEIAKARQRGASMVWVSHSLEEDLDLADQVLYLDNKKQSYLGPAKDFRDRCQESRL
ncbi:ATP-binding cassette domain-containing protein [Desulfonatronospira sp.]|uniref:ATP-binding cassette domain-containing protein n=1 Tax=Desulfonatronospira sp. TaxID=1962951 RepID=UPI0025C2B0D6|nr:ABC transporter ATP-binding protein [Desulfonatronospira sp.]